MRCELRSRCGLGDTVTFTGQVTGKGEDGGLRWVECEVTGTNQDEVVVAKARARVPL